MMHILVETNMTTRDVYEILEPAHFLKDQELFVPQTPVDTETGRRLSDFSREVDIAAFMLAMSYKKPYLDLFEEKDFNNEFKHKYYSQHYLYSALIWYQNCYDMFGQCLWFYYRLYKQDGLKLTSGDFDKIITRCKENVIKERLYGNKANPYSNFKQEHRIVFEYGNKLKHRLFLENEGYMQYKEFANLKDRDYDAGETKSHILITDVQELLIKYHQALVSNKNLDG